MAAKKGSKEYFKMAHIRMFASVREGEGEELIDDLWKNSGAILGRILERDNFIVIPVGDFELVAVSFRLRSNGNHSDYARKIQDVIDVLRSHNFQPYGKNVYLIRFNDLYFMNRPVQHLQIWAEWLNENTEYDFGFSYEFDYATFILKSDRNAKHKLSNPEVFFGKNASSYCIDATKREGTIRHDLPFIMFGVSHIPSELEDYC